MLLAFGREEAARLTELRAAMQRAGMVPHETIVAYPDRVGWTPVVAEAYQRRRAEINAATIAALERIEAVAKAQTLLQQHHLIQWLVAVLEVRIVQVQAIVPAEQALFEGVA